MKTKKVNSLKGLKAGVIYNTDDYTMFNIVKGNRGRLDSFKPQKVAEYVKKIEENTFYGDSFPILVNMKFYLIDGYSRLQACIRTGISVHFIITENPALNVEKSAELLDMIAYINEVDPTWKRSENFNSAFVNKEPLAVAISKAIAATNAEYDLRKPLSPSQMYAIGTNAPFRGKRSRKNYRQAHLAKLYNTEEVKKNIKFACKVAEHFKTGMVLPSRVLEQLMPLVAKGVVNRDVFYHHMKKDGFNIFDDKAKTVRDKIMSLSRKGLHGNTNVIRWDV